MTSTPITREELERLTMDCLVIARNTEGVGRNDMGKLLPTHKDLLSFVDSYTNAKVLEAKIEVCDKYLAYRAASDTESEAIEWLDFNRTELKKEQD